MNSIELLFELIKYAGIVTKKVELIEPNIVQQNSSQSRDYLFNIRDLVYLNLSVFLQRSISLAYKLIKYTIHIRTFIDHSTI